ncbi:unnamed protein product [Closterium sp. Yama58-4]|nr:unnamed protein product [Closterium sp. Yama58-4]
MRLTRGTSPLTHRISPTRVVSSSVLPVSSTPALPQPMSDTWGNASTLSHQGRRSTAAGSSPLPLLPPLLHLLLLVSLRLHADLERGPANVAEMGGSVCAGDADVDGKGSERKREEGEGVKAECEKGEVGKEGSGKSGDGKGGTAKCEAQGQEQEVSAGKCKQAGSKESDAVQKGAENGNGGGNEGGVLGKGEETGGSDGSGMLHVFRVDPANAKLYCQCLSLLGKLFLEHKPQVYTVEGHTFYVLTRGSDTWHTLIGYFAIESSLQASQPPKRNSPAAGTEAADSHRKDVETTPEAPQGLADPRRLEAKAGAGAGAPNVAQEEPGDSHGMEVDTTPEAHQKLADPRSLEAEADAVAEAARKAPRMPGDVPFESTQKAAPKAPQEQGGSLRMEESCTAANQAEETRGGSAALSPSPSSPPAILHLSSVVVLPPFQRRGFGRCLISVAYDMAAALQQRLVPKPPLSDLGNVAFRSFWRWQLLRFLKKLQGSCSIDSLSKSTALQSEDIRTALKQLKLTKYLDASGNISVPPSVLSKKTKHMILDYLLVDGSPAQLVTTGVAAL